ncbi:MAG TPA: MoaD/ThiS family protein [Aestuariivirgaceae bacterium]|jgi:molybdopterin converting factor small subunit
MVQVHFWGALKPLAGGESSVDIEARNIRELFGKLGELHPGMKPHIERGIAVSINGKIYRDSWDELLPEKAEIYLLPRIAGG